MNEQENKQDNDQNAIADLEEPNAAEIKGGMLEAGRVRVSSSSGVNATAHSNLNGNLQIASLTS
jgi:hypothetical protein